MTKKVRKHCNICGSTAVNRDAWLIWDEIEQDWVISDMFDTYYCEDCESSDIDPYVENIE